MYSNSTNKAGKCPVKCYIIFVLLMHFSVVAGGGGAYHYLRQRGYVYGSLSLSVYRISEKRFARFS